MSLLPLKILFKESKDTNLSNKKVVIGTDFFNLFIRKISISTFLFKIKGLILAFLNNFLRKTVLFSLI